MESVGKEPKTNPAATANCLSKLLFWWLNPMFYIGNQRRLEEEDLYEVLLDDKSEIVGQSLQRHWENELLKAAKEMRTPKFKSAIIRCFLKEYLPLGLVSFLLEGLKFSQPLLLEVILVYLENVDPEDEVAYHKALGYTAGFCFSSLVISLVHHFQFFLLQRTGWRIRVAVGHMIYKKTLCLSNSAIIKTTTGQIVNLLSNDVNMFDELTIFLHYIYIGPVQVAIVIILLWFRMGLTSLAGLGVIVMLLPIQVCCGAFYSKYRQLSANLTDNRIRIMNEVVSGMRIIKMYAWEKPFTALVTDVRREEIAGIIKSSYVRGVLLTMFFCASKIFIFVLFAIHVALGNTIKASTVFLAMSLYNAVRLTATFFFPRAIETMYGTNVSLNRFQEFLLLDEITPPCDALPEIEKTKASVEFQDIICYWDKNLSTPSLQNVSFTLDSNKLLAVIGQVGAGKSSLLSAILRELPVENGLIKVSGNLTYTAQQPWVFPGTIRGNILFGKELNPQKYELVLKACALKRDLELFPDGDLTLIGDRGVNLSGGQKARVNLARAVYQDADLYLLDDPLSAVDAEVGRHLFEQCICGLLKNKTRILVTHQLQYLKAANEIVVLKEGYMVAKGTYTELQRSGVDFTSLLKKDEEENPQKSSDIIRKRTQSQNLSRSRSSTTNSIVDDDYLPADNVPTVAEESRSFGSVPVSLYVKYLTAGSNIMWVIVSLVVGLFAQILALMQDWWLAHWADEQKRIDDIIIQNGQNMTTQGTTAQLDTDLYLAVFGGITLATIVFAFIRNFHFLYLLVMSIQALHNQMFNAIIRAPVRFFDINPVGRILNRFSKDVGQLDLTMPINFVDFVQTSMQVLGTVIMTAVLIPWVLIILLPLMVIFFFLQRYYLQTSRDIKRLEGTTRSPIFSHLSSSLAGLWTIRAFKAEERLQNIFDAQQNVHSEAWFLFLSTSRWLALRLDIICWAFIVVVSFSCMLLKEQLGAGAVGLALSYSVQLIILFQWGARQSVEVENMMTSVERVVDYTNLESEGPWENDKRPPPDWPKKGLITFDRVNFAYSSDGPLVLKDINLTFKPKEKIGVVGRTGAGKSSLVSAVFRLSEAEGNIYIDGVLTSEIGLHDLRSKISIIPQDPMLFTGTVRKNLDPFNQHTDEQMWQALEEVQLKSMVEDLPAKLATVLAESGSNFSVGQRQLVCLARAILRKNRVLIIDEATANVDLRTDELIQKTIREKFRECTVITIAHRLNTIIDSDRILVLDAGNIKAFDEPYVLLQNPNGIFYNMVQQTGKQEAASLHSTAKQVYDSRIRTSLPNGHKDSLVISETPM
ncbi:ATP-binding cassette sub-family C member 4-like [Solea solea]|uniref:ATP-binding cassette sub-family C member 4-like n=1 Tax=Solea solea TaxID=90069 RepID=UPI00272A5BB1|nr:ATP-binding cassette sub-family C member 4-like [Solea solea]